jgi:hypothetical protein
LWLLPVVVVVVLSVVPDKVVVVVAYLTPTTLQLLPEHPIRLL